MIRYYFYFIVMLFLAGCQDNLELPQGLEMDLLAQDIEILDSVRLIYSDSSFVRAIVTGPKMHRRKVKRYSEDEFVQGVHAEFYDRSMQLQSTLDAGYAVRKEKDSEIFVRDHVVLTNVEGEKLETSELVWKEKARQVTTEKPYKITRKDGTVITGFGFTSNEDFTVFRSHSVQSRFNMKRSP